MGKSSGGGYVKWVYGCVGGILGLCGRERGVIYGRGWVISREFLCNFLFFRDGVLISFGNEEVDEESIFVGSGDS